MRRQVSICAPRCTVREGARGLEPIEKSTQARGAHWSHFWPACRARRCCESPLSIVVFEAARRSASDSSCRSRTMVRRRSGGGGAEPRVEDGAVTCCARSRILIFRSASRGRCLAGKTQNTIDCHSRSPESFPLDHPMQGGDATRSF